MRNQSAVFIVIAIISILFVLPGFAQDDMVVVAGDVFAKQRRPASVFRHDDHNETAEIEECNECHHVYENGERITDESSEGQSCADCHTEKTIDSRPGLRRAYHLNCKGCHQSKKRGPVMCGECHVK
ncbi:MAG: cytochrome c3 family protein [Desulfobacterales bacterium]